MEKNLDIKWPLDDVISGKWNKKYQISKNLPLFFKLNDNVKLINHIKQELKEDESLKERLQAEQEKLSEFKEVKIWLKVDDSILKLTLYDVYTSLLKHLRHQSFEDQLFKCQSVSLMGPLGPYTDMPLIDCLNDELVDKFVFNQILKNKLPVRNLRVHANSDIKIAFGNMFEKKGVMKLKQISDAGILFSCTDEEVLTFLGDGEHAKVFLDTKQITAFNNAESSENDTAIGANENLFYTDDQLSYFIIEESKMIKSLSYKSAKTNEIFFFCRYKHMEESGIGKTCTEFMKQVKSQMGEYLDS